MRKRSGSSCRRRTYLEETVGGRGEDLIVVGGHREDGAKVCRHNRHSRESHLLHGAIE